MKDYCIVVLFVSQGNKTTRPQQNTLSAASAGTDTGGSECRKHGGKREKTAAELLNSLLGFYCGHIKKGSLHSLRENGIILQSMTPAQTYLLPFLLCWSVILPSPAPPSLFVSSALCPPALSFSCPLSLLHTSSPNVPIMLPPLLSLLFAMYFSSSLSLSHYQQRHLDRSGDIHTSAAVLKYCDECECVCERVCRM